MFLLFQRSTPPPSKKIMIAKISQREEKDLFNSNFDKVFQSRRLRIRNTKNQTNE